MAFNSNTYHANKAQRTSADYLAKARDLKRRIAAGEKLYDWERDSLPFFVSMARSYARSSRIFRSLNDLRRKRQCP